jgi:hypothetical protein
MSFLSSYLPRGMVPQSQILILEGQTFTFEQDTFALVCLVGGGGSGALYHRGNQSTDVKAGATGGNGGGVCIQLIRMIASEDYTFTLGTGGAERNASGTTEVGYNGLTGNDSTLTSTATGFSTITAKGGYGGVNSYAAFTGTDATDLVNTTQTGSNAGTGADIVFGPGYGGPITIASHSANRWRNIATGGGAPNIYGAAQSYLSGGMVDIQNLLGGTNTQNCSYTFATGGGGMGGRGGAFLIWGRPAVSSMTGPSGGGGADTGAVTSYSNNSAFTNNIQKGEGSIIKQAAMLGMTGDGVDGETQSGSTAPSFDIPGSGGGAGGFVPQGSGGNGDLMPDGGIGGGGGGNAVSGTPAGTYIYYAGDGGYGAGGGGMCSSGSGYTTNPAQARRSGSGGDGFAILCVMTDFGKVIT